MFWGILLIAAGVWITYRALRSADGWAYKSWAANFWAAVGAAFCMGLGMVTVLISWLS